MSIFWGVMIPFVGTVLGAACVFLLKNEIRPLIQKVLLGFASGVMVAASVWSLLIPAMEMSESMGRFAFVPAAVGLGCCCSASAYGSQGTGRAEEGMEPFGYAGAGSDAP